MRFNLSKFLFAFLCLFTLTVNLSCNTTSDDLNAVTGNNPNGGTGSSTSNQSKETAYLKITKVGFTTSFQGGTIGISDSLNLRAVLIDSTGSVIQEVESTWVVLGTLQQGDLTATEGAQSKYADFDASAAGTGIVQATMVDTSPFEDQYAVVSATANTGNIIVTTTLTPDQVLIVAGNSQSGQVGTNLATNLKVRVINAASTPIPGASVTFATSSGTIISAQPVSTDASGEAECTVQLGGAVGTDVQSFTATINTGSVPQVNFTASGTPGPVAQIAFTTQPDGANTGTIFVQQPVVALQDSFGNVVTSATDTITMSKLAGTGNLTGTLAVSAVSGYATFTDLEYDTAEAGVQLQATDGTNTGNSSTFTVGTIPLASQCQADGGGWLTADGGCKDLTSGLIWSARSPSTMTWSNAVWDSTVSGSGAPEAWEIALGITDDVYGTDPDLSAGDYCHSLTESGLSDWRMPTNVEINSAATRDAYSRLKDGTSTSYFWSSYASYGNTNRWRAYFNTTSSVAAAASVHSTLCYARCVRNATATQLVFTTQPGASNVTYSGAARENLGVNVAFENQPVVEVRDSTNSIVTNYSGNVTLTHTGTGNLGGTTTVAVVNGVATFTDISYDKAETIQLTASSGSLASVSSTAKTIYQTYPLAGCQNTNGTWIQGVGGCKNIQTGIIWSARSPTTMNWHDAVWDESYGPNNGTDDALDGEPIAHWTGAGHDHHEYHSSPGANPDNSSNNYCHDLTESGQTDWYLPMYATYELEYIGTTWSGVGFVNIPVDTNYYWTSYTNPSNDTTARAQRTMSTVTATNANKTTANYYVLCARRDPPASMSFASQPLGHGTWGYGLGVPFTTQPVIKILDADGAPTRIRTTVTLTLGGDDGNGFFIEDGVVKGRTVSVATDWLGVATFSKLAYHNDSAQAAVTMTASIPDTTWRGQAITISDVTSTTMNFPATWNGSDCLATGNNWTDTNGGCEDTLNSIVWSHVVSYFDWDGTTGATWHQAVWDSAIDAGSEETGGSATGYGPYSNDTNDGDSDGDEDEYANNPVSNPDNNTTGICHDLILNGYSDWRLPTTAEQITAMNRTASAALNYWNTGGFTEWSANTSTATSAGTGSYGMYKNTSGVAGTNSAYDHLKTTAYHVRCVRTP